MNVERIISKIRTETLCEMIRLGWDLRDLQREHDELKTAYNSLLDDLNRRDRREE